MTPLRPLIAPFVGIAALLFGCSAPAPEPAAAAFDTAPVKAVLDSMNKSYDGRFRDSTAAYFTARYTADACVFAPNMPRVCGIAAITDFYWFGGDSQTLTLDIQGQEVSGTVHEVSEVGTYRVIDDEGTVLDEGKFIALYRHEGGAWKVHREIWNSDRAVPTATDTTVVTD
jgi:ketosteroid isomerase-like protein